MSPVILWDAVIQDELQKVKVLSHSVSPDINYTIPTYLKKEKDAFLHLSLLPN
jgi:hypothetical protein